MCNNHAGKIGIFGIGYNDGLDAIIIFPGYNCCLERKVSLMEFEYATYYRQNCVIPVVLILFCVALLAYSVYKAVSKSHYENIKIFFKDNRGLLVFIIMMLFLISVNIPPLARGGYCLFFEKEKDAVEIVGVIEETFELPWFGGSKYDVEQNQGNGEGIVINGIKYYLVTYGDYEKGDFVSIKVLPKSKLVLEMSDADRPHAESVQIPRYHY